MIKRILVIISVILLLAIAVLLFRAFTFTSPPQALPTLENAALPQNKPERSVKKLAHALTFRTISHKAGMRNNEAFTNFHNYLDSIFPLFASRTHVDTVGLSLMYTWPGKNPKLKPLVLMAHQDVVPVEYNTQAEWELPPFAGKAKNGYLYGRGTLDDKGAMLAIMEAVHQLLEQNINPQRTLIMCFGHDEEIGGREGAAQLSALLQKRGVSAAMVLDEGGTLSKGIVPGIQQPVALVGTSEKGYVSLELIAKREGGHSSMPEKDNAVTALHRALAKLMDNPPPNRISTPMEGFMKTVGPEMPFVQKIAFANKALFKPLIFRVYQQSAAAAALVHTTQVPTMLQAGIKDNVVPTRAKAVVNYRLLPGDEPREMLERARSLIADSAVGVRIYDDFAIPASPVSPDTGKAFGTLAAAIKAVQDTAVIVSPYLVLGATDGRYFYNISKQVYRFSPFPLRSEDLARIHGLNERIKITDYARAITFYQTLILNY